jgi:hypothetical protein
LTPIYDEKALLVSGALVVADLHLGLEHEFSKKGMKIPSQAKLMERKISSLLKAAKAKKLIILGDLKHNIPKFSWQEYVEIPQMINNLSKLAEVIVVKGNHDGKIEKMLGGIEIVKELSLGGFLFTHGHLRVNSLEYEGIVVGHNHPCIEFVDDFGKRIAESAWINAKFKKSVLEKYKVKKIPSLIVMPAFNHLIFGTPFNREKKLLGPFFRRKEVDLENAEAYLLDGTPLGKIKDLR